MLFYAEDVVKCATRHVVVSQGSLAVLGSTNRNESNVAAKPIVFTYCVEHPYLFEHSSTNRITSCPVLRVLIEIVCFGDIDIDASCSLVLRLDLIFARLKR